MEFTKKSIKAKFELAKTLKEAGLSNQKIAGVLNRKVSTIKLWSKFATYDEYQKYINGELKPKSIKDFDNHTDFCKEVLARLERIEKHIIY